jgi:hypothetical protein
MNFDTICIVGGGSSGWMTASTLVKAYPDKTIYLVESPSVSTIGVGESTTQFIRRWLSFLELKDEEWMPYCDATYKYSVRFENFNQGKPFHYPFGEPELQIPMHDWFVYRHLVGNDAIGFDETFWQYLNAIENSKYLPSNHTKHHSGFHFNAVKFAEWLRDHYAIPRGVRHIKGHVVDVQQKENGFIEAVHLDTSVFIKADLFFDCTGFKSLLLGETLQVPFESFGDKLLNTHAYAVQVPYQDKRRELKPYTNCTALSSGWVWTVPVWSRIGTGYNYSEKFISHEDALDEFKLFLGDRLPEDAIIRNIKFRTGISERVWEKNVVAIGLSGGFIEPLESNGLLSVHEWLMQFVEICTRPIITTIDIDCFNWKCISFFKTFSDFVALHYALTTRCDSEYWRYITNEYHFVGDSNLFTTIYDARTTSNLNSVNWDAHGPNLCIMAGHNYNPTFNTKIGNTFDWNLLKGKIEEIHNSRKQITNSLQDIYDYYSGGMYVS